MARPLLLTMAALAAVAACGCGPRSAAPAPRATAPGAPLSGKELRWVRSLRRWQGSLDRAIAPYEGPVLGSMTPVPARAVRAVAGCRSSLARRAGRPPTARLEPAYAALARDCQVLGRVRDDVERSTPIAAEQDWVRAGDARLAAFRDIHRFFRDARDPAFGLPPRATRTDHLYSALATRLLRRRLPGHERVEVRCWSAADWRRIQVEEGMLAGEATPRRLAGGVSPFTAARLDLAPDVCANLDLLARDGVRDRGAAALPEAIAVGVLAHEAEHTMPSGDERHAECAAVQELPALAELMGDDPAHARHMQALYWRDVYPYRPASYRSRECRSGGSLDLHPASPRFP